MANFDFEAIGTKWHIELDTDEKKQEELLRVIHDRIELFDKNYSRFRKDSLITKMSQNPGTYTLPSDAEPLFDLYFDLYTQTEGKVTPLIGETLSQAGYDADYSFIPKEILKPPAWSEVLTYIYPTLSLERPVLLDLGACGKGYLVDLIAELLEVHGVSDYVIDAGGDMRIARSPGPRIGLEHPTDSSKVVGVATLGRGSICGSGGAKRAWEGYTHIIDPESLTSPRDILSVWVTSESALVADALTTTLFFVAPESITGYLYEYAILFSDYSIKSSQDFPAEFFTT